MPLGSFRFSSKIRGDNRELMLFISLKDTGDKREKFSGINFFKFFVKSLVECTLHLKMKFLRIFHVQVWQANKGRTV